MSQSQRVPGTINPENMPFEMFEGGGHHRAMISQNMQGMDVTVYHACIKPGQSHDWHSHEVDEAMYIIAGKGKYELEEGEFHYKASDFVFMPKGTLHRNSCTSDEEVYIVAIFQPSLE
jgi:quercetin dioxygenase-like cupin family protein